MPRDSLTTAGRFCLAILVAWAVGSLCVSAAFLWTPYGTVGFTSNYDGTVTSVAAGSPADVAGITPGDRIVLSRTLFESRPKLIGTSTPIAVGRTIPFVVQHGATVRNLQLTAVEYVPTAADRFSQILSLISAAVFIIVGASLILLRPSIVTWGFGLFCLLTNPVVPALSRFPSAPAHLVYVLLYDVLQNVGVIGLLAFALNFPRRLDRAWRPLLARMLRPLFVVLALWTMSIDLGVCVFAVPMQMTNVALQLAFAIVDVLAIALLTETYVLGPVEYRPRLRWVLVGFYIGLVCNYVGNLLVYTSNSVLPAWLDYTLIACEVTLPLTVAYAVVRHRVIDVDFFLSRALIYALMTSVLVVIFGISDWIFGRVLEDFRLSIILDALVSIGAAFAFDGIRGMLERGIDRIIFRDRRVARDRLERTARTFRFANAPTSIEDALVREPHEALNIATVALFKRNGSAYHRIASAGWNDRECCELTGSDRLVLEHLAVEGVLHPADIPWHRDDVPGNLDRPALSIPLRCGNELVGFLLCSLKRHGEQLDPEEVQWLARFADAGATAYQQLETEELRKTAQDLQTQVAVLDARLEEAHRPTQTTS